MMVDGGQTCEHKAAYKAEKMARYQRRLKVAKSAIERKRCLFHIKTHRLQAMELGWKG